MYEFAGRVVGKCLYESALGGAYKQMVRARFTRSFLAQIIGLRMNYKVPPPPQSHSRSEELQLDLTPNVYLYASASWY